MTALRLSGAALTVAALALVLRPLLFQRTSGPASRAAANLSIHRDHLRELDADLAAGKPARADYEHARLELEARLLEDLRASDVARRSRARVSKTGTATPQAGDLQGLSAPAASDATGVKVVIDTEVR